MELYNVRKERQRAFCWCGKCDHDLAVITVPNDQPVGSAGLAHMVLGGEGGAAALQECSTWLMRYDIRVACTADQALTKSVSCCGPTGNCLEICSQEMPPAEGKQWLQDARVGAGSMKPLDLETVPR